MVSSMRRTLLAYWHCGRLITKAMVLLAGIMWQLVSTPAGRRELWVLSNELRIIRSLDSIQRRKGDG
jgi:hypothetical protein